MCMHIGNVLQRMWPICYIVIICAANNVAMQGNMSSTVMVLADFSWNIPRLPFYLSGFIEPCTIINPMLLTGTWIMQQHVIPLGVVVQNVYNHFFALSFHLNKFLLFGHHMNFLQQIGVHSQWVYYYIRWWHGFFSCRAASGVVLIKFSQSIPISATVLT